MSDSGQLERLEHELVELEAGVFDRGRDELRPRMDDLITRIAALSATVDAQADGARLRSDLVEAAPSWHQRKREEQLQREWERWRYQRSKLPREKRGRMMSPGQRECRYCGRFFEPSTLRQRYCTDSHRKMAHKSRAA
jgi:hypothetical protein